MSHVINNAVHSMTIAAMWTIVAVVSARLMLMMPYDVLLMCIAFTILMMSITCIGTSH
jgi:hypothetical protein